MRYAVPLALVSLCSAAEPGELRQLVRDALSFTHGETTNHLSYSWRSDRKQFDSTGNVTSSTSVVGEKFVIDGVPVYRVLERDGKKLEGEEAREEEKRIRKMVDQTKTGRSKKKNSENEWVGEAHEAMNFKLLGEEVIKGRPVWVLACSPNSVYQAKSQRARVFEKMNGKLWIDQQDRELVRVEAETFEDIDIGFGILGRLVKGTRLQLARTRLPEGEWVLASQSIRFGARVMLVKWIRNEIDNKQWNYRRNQALKPASETLQE